MKTTSRTIGTAWLIALGGAAVSAGVTLLSVWGAIGVMGLACFASTFLTRASKSAGLGIVFVSNALLAILVAMVIRTQTDGVIDQSVVKSGDASALVEAAGETVGFLAMVVGAAAVSVPAFVLGLVGSLVGAAVRPKATS